ncbi:DDE-type integrase/transposase/recombinase [Aquimarina sp. ERC-38]|uniref:DDE-type integrase/transposase/recombinase n=1 Tax=Aquimarina sp. ERC-38 TaxID=2949996 RepID=UPI0022471A28|nr:DDE-type integrase/transposase/recombinase [Aquimarina sp. ERC-38]UZO81321.1 DDE-type integrase/transposase/recombinase [Aquimarina sp. ERC-38]
MEELYKHIGKTRQGVYYAGQRKDYLKEKEAVVLNVVRSWRMSHPQMGSRVMYYSLQAKGVKIPMGITRFEELISRFGLTASKPKRFIPLTSDGKGKSGYSNLTNGLIINDCYRLLVVDITYFWLVDQWCHLFVIKDAYSQRLVSLYPSWDLKAQSALQALSKGLSLVDPDLLKGCIHHSDNGSQYNALSYRKLLAKLGMKISRAASCKQNGSCEQMHHIIKNMYLVHFAPKNMAELKRCCQKVVHLMNAQRAVKQLGYRTVIDFEEDIAKMEPSQRPKKELYDFDNA